MEEPVFVCKRKTLRVFLFKQIENGCWQICLNKIFCEYSKYVQTTDLHASEKVREQEHRQQQSNSSISTNDIQSQNIPGSNCQKQLSKAIVKSNCQKQLSIGVTINNVKEGKGV